MTYTNHKLSKSLGILAIGAPAIALMSTSLYLFIQFRSTLASLGPEDSGVAGAMGAVSFFYLTISFIIGCFAGFFLNGLSIRFRVQTSRINKVASIVNGVPLGFLLLIVLYVMFKK